MEIAHITTQQMVRGSIPEKEGSSATDCATYTVYGFSGPVAKPVNVGNRTIITPVMVS